MPTYEYECRSCHHTFEAFQSIKEEALKKCPKCGKNNLRRLFGGGLGIIFKGSGFYSTDNRRSSALVGGNGSSRGESKSDAKTDTKSDTKSESKSESKSSGEKAGSSSKN
jgi:putative FmdB family regulatory protein